MLEQAVRFLHVDLMFVFAVILQQDEEGRTDLQEHKDAVQRLRQTATDFMEISERILSHSMHPKVAYSATFCLDTPVP